MGREETTPFLDVIFLALAGFVSIVLIMFPYINPPGEDKKDDIESPGNMIIEVYWDEGSIDVDTWVKAPGQRPVGYSNKSGPVFNLLRDDIGTVSDPGPRNRELVASRGLPAGEYIINLHMYQNLAEFPVNVTVIVSIKRFASTSADTLFERNVQLNMPKQEMTVARFRIDNNKKYVPDSLHDAPINIRSADY